MRKIFETIESKGESYSVIIKLEGDEIIDMLCDCRFMSFDFWSQKNQERKTLCRHILKVLAKNNLELPIKYKTERNLKLMEKFKLNKEEKI